MIRVWRRPLPPDDEAALALWQQRVNGCKPQDERIGREWLSFNKDHLRIRIERSLARQSKRKCVYCEQKGARAIDHYQPKLLFPALAFAWSNLNWACTDCNFDKGPWLKTERGVPLLLNPTAEPVEEYFFIDLTTGRIMPRYGLDEAAYRRAAYTIRKLNLDVDSLRDERRAAYLAIRQALRAYRVHQSRETEAALRFALSRRHPMRAVARQVVRSREPELRRLVDDCLHRSERVRRYVDRLGWSDSGRFL